MKVIKIIHWVGVMIIFLLYISSNLYGQNTGTVSGEVIDAQSGETLPGVNVMVKGTTTGTSTGGEGRYELNVPSLQDTLIFSFVGYQTQEVPINGRTEIDVALQGQAIAGEELVVVGYGEQKEINLTGAVSSIDGEELENRSVGSMDEALQGVAPNLNFVQGTGSTEPGGEMNMNIRGVGSLTGDTSPYVVVDGVPMDINNINPNDVESISVLKDAAASAIYGARAPYGVIVITTKKGQMNEEVSIRYSNNISFSSPIGLPQMVNSLKYMTAHDQASLNAGLGRNFSEENYDRVKSYIAGEITEETWKIPDENDWYGNGIWSIAGNGNNDWMDIYYDDFVMRQKHDISLRGGGQNNTYYVSAGIWDQPGELNFADQKFKRYNLVANLSSEATKWLTAELNFKFTKKLTQNFNTQQGWDRPTMYHNFFRTNPFRPLKLPNGEYSNISYIPMLQGGKENMNENLYNISFNIVFEPIENWETTVLYNYQNNTSRMDDNHETVYGAYPNREQYVIAYPQSSFGSQLGNEEYQLFNLVTSYNISFDEKHNFNLMGGLEGELNEFNDLFGSRNNIVTSNVPSISTSIGELDLEDTKTHWSTMGVFGRFTYNFNEIYLFELNSRYDGTSRFGEGNRWGFFPSFSMGYNVSNESFWEPVEPYISNLKIRGSWGALGNQNVANYLYMSNIGVSNNLGWIIGDERPTYTLAPDLIRQNLTWESSTTLNLGLDASFLRERLSINFDIFKRTTSDMFGPAEALPQILGTSVPEANNASLETRGFEFVLSWRDNIKNDISYNLGLSFSDNVSEVTEYNNPTNTLSTWYEGQRIGEIWGLETVGIYQNQQEVEQGPDQSLFHPNWGPGDIQYNDLDGDGEITRGQGTSDEPGDYTIIGNDSPRYRIGLNGGLRWKGFDLSMFWQGILKKDYAFSPGDQVYHGFNGQSWWDMNIWEQAVDYWRPADETNLLGPNTDAFYPKPYLSQEDHKNRQVQTKFTENAAYLRLKNVTIGYTIPNHILSKISMSRARIFISGENLLTITDLTNIDPEALINTASEYNTGKIHPLRKSFAVGIDIGF